MNRVAEALEGWNQEEARKKALHKNVKVINYTSHKRQKLAEHARILREFRWKKLNKQEKTDLKDIKETVRNLRKDLVPSKAMRRLFSVFRFIAAVIRTITKAIDWMLKPLSALRSIRLEPTAADAVKQHNDQQRALRSVTTQGQTRSHDQQGLIADDAPAQQTNLSASSQSPPYQNRLQARSQLQNLPITPPAQQEKRSNDLNTQSNRLQIRNSNNPPVTKENKLRSPAATTKMEGKKDSHILTLKRNRTPRTVVAASQRGLGIS